MNKLGTVIRFSLMSKIRKRSFIITMIVVAVLITILANVPYFINKYMNDEDKPLTIGLLYEQQPAIAAKLQEISGQIPQNSFKLLDYKEPVSSENLQKEIEEGTIDGYLQFGASAEPSSGFPAVSLVTKSGSKFEGNLQTTLQSLLQNVKLQTIAGGSLSDAQLTELGQPVLVTEQKAGDQAGGTADGTKGGAAGDKSKESDEAKLANYLYVYALIILFLLINTMTGSMIASEVTSEKSSRIMEILITSVSPLTQMFGKIIAMFVLGMMQIVFFTLVVVGNIAMPQNRDAIMDLGVDLTQISLDVFLYGLLFYILGYFLFATLFAAIGSLVSRTEELGQAIMPISLILMVSFYIGLFCIPTPNSMLIKIASFVPVTSPISMLVRIGMGEVAGWEIGVSIGILLLSILLFGWLSAKIYRTGVLMYGKRPSLKELSKALRAYKM